MSFFTPTSLPDVFARFDPVTATITYALYDPDSPATAIIDPVLDFHPNGVVIDESSTHEMLEALAKEGRRVDWVLETHAHADHLSSAHLIRHLTGAKVAIGAEIGHVQAAFAPLFGADDAMTPEGHFDVLLKDGDQISVGGVTIRTLHTPGHTPACVSYLTDGAVFVGDTLFMPDFGTARTDFPGGDAGTLYRSAQRLLALPPETRMFVGHDYPPAGRPDPAWETSVADQRAGNIHVREGVTEDEFVTMRTAKDATLSAPRLILPSLHANIRAGAVLDTITVKQPPEIRS